MLTRLKHSLCLLLTVSSFQAYGSDYQIDPMPKELEIRLALTALPDHLKGNATVYALHPTRGYQVAREGTNGFHALVMRSSYAGIVAKWDFDHYPENIYAPVAYDSAAINAHMKVLSDIEKMKSSGVSPTEAEKLIMSRYENGDYQPPSRPGIAYMLSPIFSSYDYDEESNDIISSVSLKSVPHYMFYAPNLENSDIGGVRGSHVFITNPGIHGFMIHGANVGEALSIIEKNSDLLNDLCNYKEALCLSR